MRISFKNVGQGDSILIEWQDDGIDKIGIIDCNRYDGRNPILEYIINQKYRQISFLILTHPHTDHFSGFFELITYCLDNGIVIKYFFHTSTNMPGFWKAAVTGKVAEEAIIKLFQIIRTARDNFGLIPASLEALHPMNKDLSLGEYSMRILAPTSVQLDSFANNISESPFEEEEGNTPSANWLSTLIKIHNNDWYILLTADCNKDVIKYYGIKRKEELKGRLVLGQSPHHGAFRNHNNAFWKQIKNASDKTPIVFSVGHNHYGHPSEDVVQFFKNNGFGIYSTNQVGCLTVKNNTEKSMENSLMLDAFSTVRLPLKKDQLNGDKIFDVDIKGNLTIL